MTICGPLERAALQKGTSMRSRLIHLALLVLALLAFGASTASAVPTLQDNTTGATLATNSFINLQSSGSSLLTGSFFGFGSTTLACTGFQAVGKVVHNPGAALTIEALKYTGCKNQNLVTCTSGPGAAPGEWVGFNLPWYPATAPLGYNSSNGGIVAKTATQLYLGFGSAGFFRYPGMCTFTGQDCDITGAGASQSDGSGDHSVTNNVSVTWTNPNGTTSPSQVNINNAAVKSASGFCISSGTWSVKLTARVGNTVGAGNLVKIV
jgi:hypothetical protein